MGIIEAIILGLVQGLSEFLPVSSSGHLIIVEKILGVGSGTLFFDVMLHAGTLLALVSYFRNDLRQLVSDLFRKKLDNLGLSLIIGTIPAVVVGFLLQSSIENSFRSVRVVAFNLFWVAILMLWVERLAHQKKLSGIKWLDGLTIGTAQALALVPGISRSGITISAGMMRGFKREAAARFSFLLAIPITFGAIIKLMLTAGFSGVGSYLPAFIAGTLTAAMSGYLVIKFLLGFLSNHRLDVFAYYRIGLALMLLLATGLSWL